MFVQPLVYGRKQFRYPTITGTKTLKNRLYDTIIMLTDKILIDYCNDPNDWEGVHANQTVPTGSIGPC